MHPSLASVWQRVQSSHGNLLPSHKELYLSCCHFLVHSDLFKSQGNKSEEKILCSCGTNLGCIIDDAAKIWKDKIDQPLWNRYTLEKRVAFDLNSISRAHTVYRFCISSNVLCICLLLIGNVDLFVNGEWICCMKVLFRAFRPKNEKEFSACEEAAAKLSLLPSIKIEKVESLNYEIAEIDSLLSILRASNERFPKSASSVHGAKYAHLQRFVHSVLLFEADWTVVHSISQNAC